MASAPNSSDEDEAHASSSSLIDALLVYAEPLTARAHVVVIGDAESSVASRLLDLGARSVQVFDPDPARAANAARNVPRGVTIRALVEDLDVRDGAFDLAVVPDLAELNDPHALVERLRQAITPTGAVVAMGRTTLSRDDDEDSSPPFLTELGPASLEYAELYDLFATQFDEVTLAGVVPFVGVVFAELGGESEEAPAVSVDTRLAEAAPPRVFVVVAGQGPALDPYAIVQIAPPPAMTGRSGEPLVRREPQADVEALEAAFAAAQLKADLLTTQLEEARDRLMAADARVVDASNRVDRSGSERDSALTRAMELEAVLAASQQTMGGLERRLLEAEQGMLERDDRIASLSAELDARHSESQSAANQESATKAEHQRVVEELTLRAERAEAALASAMEAARADNERTLHFNVDVNALRDRAERAEAALAVAAAELASRQEADQTTAYSAAAEDLRERAERAEAALAIGAAEVAQVAEAHALETAGYEEQLRDRARVIAGLDKELVRREQLVKELVASLEDARAAHDGGRGHDGVVFEAATPLSQPSVREATSARHEQEISALKEKLDQLAADIARREGELIARGWRITELEDHARALEQTLHNQREAKSPASPKLASAPGETLELARARDELAALRQALKSEHEARVAIESGEELSRVRSELARQTVLLEQLRSRAES